MGATAFSPSCEMPPDSDHQHYVRRVVLPSGKTIEVVYFEDLAVPSRAFSTQEAPVDLNSCTACGSGLVYPTEWEEAGATHWEVTRRCPNCEWTATGTYSQAAVERFDELLDEGTEAVVRDLKRLMHANMEEEIERFVGALDADLIVPEDF